MGESHVILSVAVLCLGVGGMIQALLAWGMEQRLKKLKKRLTGEGEQDV